MAKAKTGAFYLTEQVILTATNTAVQGSISLASYVDVASRQGIAIESVDFMYQGFDSASRDYQPTLANIGGANPPVAPLTTGAQLLDVQRGVGIVSAADRALVGSASLVQTTDGGLAHQSDLYPDNYGPVATEEARIVVNDTLFFTATTDNNFAGTKDLAVTVRVKARIVTLSERDFMSIAITSSAADN
jgi:hypothetical protein